MRRGILMIVLCALSLGALLAGCSGGGVISESTDASAYSLSCDRVSDTRQTTVIVGDSAAATLTAAISHGRGALSVRISGDDGEEVYSGNHIAASTSFTLLLEGPAEYTVYLECDGFTGSVDLNWETVGAAVAEPAPQDAQPRAPDTNDMVITNTAPSAQPDTTPVAADSPEWNGKFKNEDSDVEIELFWADNHTVEFELRGIGSVVTATARIDDDDPAAAQYTYGEELTLVFHLDAEGLTLTQEGVCSLIPDDIAGFYPPAAE